MNEIYIKKKITGKCIMLLHIMTSFIIYIRRKRHFEDILDSYKVINDITICTDIIHYPVIFKFLEH